MLLNVLLEDRPTNSAPAPGRQLSARSGEDPPLLHDPEVPALLAVGPERELNCQRGDDVDLHAALSRRSSTRSLGEADVGDEQA